MSLPKYEWGSGRTLLVLSALVVTAGAIQSACNSDGGAVDTRQNNNVTEAAPVSLVGEPISPLLFANPYAHIPAQCYIETSAGTQNACQYCHTNGVYQAGMGNNPQAGAADNIGNLQTDYSFAPYNAQAPLATINRWENTLFPERLTARVRSLGLDPDGWDMRQWIRQDNWTPAYALRGGDPKYWVSNAKTDWLLFPGLDPQDLPADADGHVRSAKASNGFFNDGKGWITGWRAVNFMPYGIFTPMSGSVSGIYIRLPEAFMRNEQGKFDLATYEANLDLLAKAVQNRLEKTDGEYYRGSARNIRIERGVYPMGTEFAHPLHYVDVAADGSNKLISPFPGTRARRVKEIRYMFKWQDYRFFEHRPGDKVEGSSIYGNDRQGWVDNGAGWYLAGWIEDVDGKLRPQRREELFQCIGCHSAVRRTEFPSFTSGTGNTVDSTWALPRQLPGALGWREMDYLGYRRDATAHSDATPGRATLGDPVNRGLNKGEFRYFLETVVGASLYGEMPGSMENFFASTLRRSAGYSADWPRLDTSSAEAFQAAQALRQRLMREFTARRAHLRDDGTLQPALVYPPENAALAAARRYRQVVATQSYHLGKDVFPETPLTFRYFRRAVDAPFTRLDGTPYRLGEIIIDRPVHKDDPASIDYLLGSAPTLIDPDKPFEAGGTYNPDYTPWLAAPLRFE